MQTHPYFNLRLHSDGELAGSTGGEIVGRVTLHEWPLSCVQNLRLQDGRQMIYKASWGPTVEAEFYAQACSSLLVSATTLYQQDGYVCLLIDWIDAPRLEQTPLPAPELLRVGAELLSEIRKLPADLPCYLDLRTPSGWQAVVEGILIPLEELDRAGKLQSVTPSGIRGIQDFCRQAQVQEALEMEPGLVHGDLGGDNVFVVQDGYRVIDWQRPIYGPRALDLVHLLESGGYQADSFVEPGIWRLHLLLAVHWFAQCAWRWFPDGLQGYDRQIAELIGMLQQS